MSEQASIPGAKDFRISKPFAETVAITSDDGPNKANIERVLGILNDHAVRATFFWFVENALDIKAKDPQFFSEILYGIGDNGHEIGLHAPRDFNPTLRKRATTAFSYEELQKGAFDLHGVTGMPVRYFRPHYAAQPLAFLYARMIGMETPDLNRNLKANTVDNYADPMAPVEEQVEKFSQAIPGGIVMFHDGISMIRRATNALEAMPSVFANLRARGLELTNISGQKSRKGPHE